MSDHEDDDYDEFDETGIEAWEQEASESDTDPEKFVYELCVGRADIERVLNQTLDELQQRSAMPLTTSRLLLQVHGWDVEKILKGLQKCGDRFLVQSNIKPVSICHDASKMCGVCLVRKENMHPMVCGHLFCSDCWASYFEEKLDLYTFYETSRLLISCMGFNCHILVPCDFVQAISDRLGAALASRYAHTEFIDDVKSHPFLRLCPNYTSKDIKCNIVSYSTEIAPKLVMCRCGLAYCFKCGWDYHAPTTCHVIRKWEKKCRDDSETSNYLQANTKDCPNCHICIEKNGGCNHMQCSSCKHDFCWMCLQDWRSHNQEYYECSRYRENPAIAKDSAGTTARLALHKYLFYYERWNNHERSLKLEGEHMEKIQTRIKEKTEQGDGTWIDWQPLVGAGDLLHKARYTLQFTYPHAYFMTDENKKILFEYRQGELERDVEELAWKVEHSELQDKAALAQKMETVKRARDAMLRDFFLERF